MGVGFLIIIIVLIVLTAVAIYYLFNTHKVDRIIQHTWISVGLVLGSTVYILLLFF